jgi:hypothetical protein
MALAVNPAPDGSAAPCYDRYMPRRNFLLAPCLAYNQPLASLLA